MLKCLEKSNQNMAKVEPNTFQMDPKMEPRGAQMEPRWSPKPPNWSLKWSQEGPWLVEKPKIQERSNKNEGFSISLAPFWSKKSPT